NHFFSFNHFIYLEKQAELSQFLRTGAH
ncbi:unnamed protein product, partial [Rotaria magnacalcarata]